MRKYITIMIIIIIILSIILGIKIMNKGTKLTNSILTAEQIRNKILEGLENTNYIYTCIEGDEKKIKKIKDNIMVTEGDNIKVWIDIETRNMIIIREIDKEAIVTTVKEDSTYLNKDFIDMKTLLNIYNDNLYYITEEKYDGRKCIIVAAGKEKYWIDNETGIVLKYQQNNGESTNFKLKLNKVTDKDVQKPSLEGYNVSYVKEFV